MFLFTRCTPFPLRILSSLKVWEITHPNTVNYSLSQIIFLPLLHLLSPFTLSLSLSPTLLHVDSRIRPRPGQELFTGVHCLRFSTGNLRQPTGRVHGTDSELTSRTPTSPSASIFRLVSTFVFRLLREIVCV